MNLISPQNFIFAGLIGAIVLLYILRLKRKERIVSSNLLWDSALRDLQANAPWQKLRSSLLMWLQIAFLCLAVFALVRPSIKVLATGGQTIAIVIDSSASMAASDVSPSRFGRARAEAARLINGLSSGDSAMLVAAAAQTHVLAPLTTDKNALQRALNNSRTEDTTCNLREAISLAASLLRNKKNAQIYVLSDGAVAPLDDLSTGKIGLQFVKIGQGNNNVAVTAMDVRRDYAQGTPYQIFATVRNFSRSEKKIELELGHDGDLVAVRPLTIPAGGSVSQLFTEGNFTQGLFSVGFDQRDDLASDNIAYASLEAARNLRVLLVSSGNIFLEKALNLDPNVQLVRTSAADFSGTGDYDVIVCDGEAPKNLPPSNQLLFNAFTEMAPVTKGNGPAQSPSVVDWDHRHPVTKFAPWNDIRFAQSQSATTKSWAQNLVEAERTPLVVAGERGGRRVVWCGFDLRDTDLPLRVTFPIFVTNSLHWLSSRGRNAQSAPLRAGDGVPLDVPAGAREVSILAPDKSTRHVQTDKTPVVFSGAQTVGVYKASAGDWNKTFGVNLLNASESDLQPRDALKVQGGKAVSGENRARANRELWGFIALAALALLGVEWWVFHRGV